MINQCFAIDNDQIINQKIDNLNGIVMSWRYLLVMIMMGIVEYRILFEGDFGRMMVIGKIFI